jgi:uncharacterized membrane protein (DUF2068 family)
VIGGLKLATGVLLAAAGFGIFRLMNHDLGETIEHLVLRFRLDPENRLVHAAVNKVAGIDHARLRAVGAGTFFYAFLESVEGVGLLQRRHWAEYLTIVATASLLPVEITELIHKLSAMRLVVFAANLAIVVYLIVRLRRDRQAEATGFGAPGGL